MRYLTMLVIGLVAGVFLGAFAPDYLQAGADTRSAAIGDAPYQDLSDDRKNIWPDDLPVPVLDLRLEPDPASGQNLILTADDFTFTPMQTNGAVVPGTGHGHMFVNGRNIGRMYSPIHHLIDLPQGEVTIHVYLGGNDHKVWVANGQPLFVEETFVIE